MAMALIQIHRLSVQQDRYIFGRAAVCAFCPQMVLSRWSSAGTVVVFLLLLAVSFFLVNPLALRPLPCPTIQRIASLDRPVMAGLVQARRLDTREVLLLIP